MTYRPPRAYRIGRNGMPEPVGYVYKGTGQDQGPNLSAEQLAAWKPDYEQWIPEHARGRNNPRPPRQDACECGYKNGSMNCRALHRSRLEAVAAEKFGAGLVTAAVLVLAVYGALCALCGVAVTAWIVIVARRLSRQQAPAPGPVTQPEPVIVPPAPVARTLPARKAQAAPWPDGDTIVGNGMTTALNEMLRGDGRG